MRLPRLLVSLALLSVFVTGVRAQNGIPSDGRDYYIAYIHPSIKCPHIMPFQGIFALVSSYYDTKVTISYFDKKSGREVSGPSYTIAAKSYRQIPLDKLSMELDPLGEVTEYAACHIHADRPVNCSYYSTGPGSGGMYLALPTGALGHHYVIATLPANDGYGASRSRYGCPPDSSSSMLAVIGVKDNTVVTITPNATSLSGRYVGKNSGSNSKGFAHPFQITLQRGQVYLLKSEDFDQDPDMSGTLVDADQPIGVIAAQENGFNGESQYSGNGGDQRDLSMEMMVPVEYWPSDGYTSIPMMDSPGAGANDPSIGDMYRIFTYDSTSTKVDFYDQYSGRHTYNVSQMQYPPTTIHNVTGGINVGSQEGQRIFVEQYDYRMQTLTEPFPAPSSMNVVPMSRWRNSYMWSVPDDKNQVHKRRYINVIAQSSQLSKIKIWTNGIGPKPITSLPSVGGSYTIPNTGSKVVGRRFEITPGAFYATADSAFGMTQYGELGLDPDFDLGDNDDDDYYFEYAAPVGQSFAIDGALRPKLAVDTFCSHWDVHVRDVFQLDGGVAQIEILNDPQGVLKRKPGTDSGYVSTNAVFYPDNFTVVPGDTVVDAEIRIANPLKDADAWVWVLNAAGNDTLIHLTYKAPALAFAANYSSSGIDTAAFMRIPLGHDSCTRFVFKNTGAPGQRSYAVTKADFIQGGQGVFRVGGTIPSLPTTLNPGDSLIVDVCFQTNTPAHVFLDTLHIVTDCPEALAAVVGSSTYPLIYATDYDFGRVPIGQSKDGTVNVKNVGTAQLLLTKEWILHDTVKFHFKDSLAVPMTLDPGKSHDFTFTYTPKLPGPDSTTQDWGTNLVAPYEHSEKDYSILVGFATAPGIVWDRPEDSMRTVCDAPVEDTIRLMNPTDPKTGQAVHVDSVVIHGPTASEWSIVQNQTTYTPPNNFNMDQKDSLWFLVRFVPDLTKPLPAKYQDRQDTLWAFNTDKIEAYVVLKGHVDYAEISSSTNNVDLGIVQPGQTTGTRTVTITNTGTAPLIIKDISVDNTAFHIVSGPGVGDTIMPGESRDIVVNATVTAEGETMGNIIVDGTTKLCTPSAMIAMVAATRFVSVQGTPHDYAPTYVCRNNGYDLTVTSTGTDPVVLKTVEILDDPSMPGASSEFHFADGSRKLTINQVLTRGTAYPYTVLFEPTVVQNSKAIIRYTYDTARNQGVAPWQEDESLTGPSLVEHQTLTAAKTDAAPDHFIATTGQTFEVPIRFTKTLPAMADARQLQFDFTFRRDLFHYAGTLDANGYQVTNVSNGNVVGDLETRTITVIPTGGATFGGADDLLHVRLQLMVARDTNSDFTVSNAIYSDSKGQVACYILHDEIPGAFTPVDLCGNDIIRRFEQTGVLTYGIREVGPNPATTSVNVTLDVRKDKSPISIEIYDALGHKMANSTSVMSTGVHTRTLDVSNLVSGEYTVRVASANGEIQTQKLVIQK